MDHNRKRGRESCELKRKTGTIATRQNKFLAAAMMTSPKYERCRQCDRDQVNEAASDGTHQGLLPGGVVIGGVVVVGIIVVIGGVRRREDNNAPVVTCGSEEQSGIAVSKE